VYKKILVPLDGSKLAECSLEHVKAIATGCNVPEVVLLQVLHPIHSAQPIKYEGLYGQGYKDFSPDFLTKSWTQWEGEAKNYLSRLSDQLKKENLSIGTALVTAEDTAGAILDYAKDNAVDLIVMTSHGRSGLSRWLMGSVAEKVVKSSQSPVLMVALPACLGSRQSS
jgi:nucleotide-binding universal stress UspA family protein